jgi:hypothetical protein
MNLMPKYLIISFFVLLSLKSFAGFGDGSGPFDSGKKEAENATSSGIGSDEGFGQSTFGASGNEEELMGGSPPPPPPIPLDGGSYLIILVGSVSGFFLILKKRKLNGLLVHQSIN